MLNAQTSDTHNPRKAYMVAILLLLLGCAVLLYVGVSLVAQAHLPSDSVLLTEYSPAGVSVATPLLPESVILKVGDQILSIDGRTIEAWAANAWEGGSAPQWHVGQRVLYRILRDGETVDVSVTLVAFPWGRLPVRRFGVYGLALVSLAVAAYILVKRPDDVGVQLLFIAALCMSVSLFLHFQVMTLVVPRLYIAESLLKWASRTLLFSSLLHLFLVFPVSKIQSHGVLKGLGGLHLINPLLSVFGGLLFGRTPALQWGLISRISTWIGLVMMLGAFVSVLHTHITVRQPAVRGQIRWIAWGTLVGFVPYLTLTGLPEALTGRPILNIEVTAFFLAALPVAVAIAVARYRLFDIDLLIGWTLLYTLYLVLLAGAYEVLRKAVLSASLLLMGRADESLAVFIASVCVASAFWILRPYVSRSANRLLYRSRLHPHHILTQMTVKLTSAIHLDQLNALLTEELPRQLGAAHGGLMVLSEDGEAMELVGGDSFRLVLDERFELWQLHGSVPIVRSAPVPDVPVEVLTLMEARGVELVIPLQIGTKFVGLLSLGPHADAPFLNGASAYTTSEIRALSLLARQAALAVQNALLVREMEAQQQRLQDEIELRTKVMASDRNRLNAILQNMADALLVTDAAGRIQLVNPAFENLMRRASRTLIGREIQQVLPLPQLLDARREALEHPGIIEVAKMVWSDPRFAPVEEAASFLNSAFAERVLNVSATALGDRSAVICILRDITHEVEIDRMKSEFVSAVSHELRTPLTAILGFAKLIQRAFDRSIQPALPETEASQRAATRINKNLDIMIQEGERLTTLINDVLDIAALDAGTVEWNDQSCELSALIQEVVAKLQGPATLKGLVLQLVRADNLPAVWVDPQRIEQVLVNLISNAVKFTEKGEILVRVCLLPGGMLVHKWKAPVDGGVLITVKDTGMGIPRAEMQQIFERFSQGGDTLLNKPKGTGLGLAISREIVEHYGGAISVESEVGVGSVFYVALPLVYSNTGSGEAIAETITERNTGDGGDVCT